MGLQYIRKALVEKISWQRKFINAHEEILSKYAIDGYKSKGRGVLLIDCSQLMEYILPGFNIPDVDYYEDEGAKELFLAGDKHFLEKYNNYDPEKTYYIVFARYTKLGEVRIWRRELKIVDEETWNKKFAFLNAAKSIGALDQEMDFDPNKYH